MGSQTPPRYQRDHCKFSVGGAELQPRRRRSHRKVLQVPEQGANVALVILVCVVVIVGAVMYVKITMGGGGDHDAADGAKSIALSFVQIIALLMTFPVAWPSAFSWIFQIGGVFTVMGQHWVDVKCLYPSLTEGEVFYRTRFVWALLPLFICLCLLTWCHWPFQPGFCP